MNARKILCPVDFSPCSDMALEHAIALAKCFDAKLMVAHVDEPPPTYTVGYAGYTSLPPYQTREDPRLEEVAIDPSIEVERAHLAGDPGSIIIRQAQQAECDLIVMGTHGRGGIAKLLLGSVAEYVLRHAKCPVIVIRDALGEKAAKTKSAAKAVS